MSRVEKKTGIWDNFGNLFQHSTERLFMFQKNCAAKAAGKLSSVAAAAAALLAAGWSETVQAETLASWDLSATVAGAPLSGILDSPSIDCATLDVGSGNGIAATSTTGYCTKGWNNAPSTGWADAMSAGYFFEISFEVSDKYSIIPESLDYYATCSGTGPQSVQWVCSVNGNAFVAIPEDSAFKLPTSTPSKPRSLSLAHIGTLAASSRIVLRLVGWSASASTGTFNFKTAIAFTGTAERIPTDGLSLDAISNGVVNCGEEPFVVRLGIFGDSGTGVTTNVTTSAAITGTTNLVDGVFTYAPTKADAALSPITFTAIVTKDGESPVSQSFDVTVNVIPPAIGEIAAQQCYAGDTNIVALTLSGDYAEAGEIVSTNAICQTYGVTGQFSTNITDGVFWYAPSMEDIAIAEENEGVIGFKVVLTVGDLAATNEFTVAVSEKPDFLEDFDVAKNYGYFVPTETFVGNAAIWQGTNFNVYSFSDDYGRGTKTAKFKASGYIQMAKEDDTIINNAKHNGAGSISFWHRFGKSANTGAVGAFEVWVSNNNGSSWTNVTDNPIAVSKNLTQTTIDNINIGGNVLVKFTYVGTPEGDGKAEAVLDDIIITDYEGQAVVVPAIGEIADRTIRADESVEIRIMFYGDNGLTKSVECTTSGVASEEYGFDAATGVFSFAPSLADLALNDGVIEFTAYLKEGDNVRASRSFSVTLLPPLPKWLELRPNVYIKENFNGMGSGKNAELPPPWRVAYTNTPMCYAALDYDSASTTNTQTATFGASTKNAGIYNLGEETTSEDRAVGFLSSSDKFITCALVVPFKNTTSSAITGFNVSFKWEKWRTGNAKKLDLRYSTGAPNWEWTSVESFHREYGAAEGEPAVWVGSENELLRDIETKTENGRVEIGIPAGGMIYLGWFYSADTKSVSGSAQCWAVDDVRISAGNPDMTTIMMK